MSQKPKTSLDKLAEKLGLTNSHPPSKRAKLPASEKKDAPQKYGSVSRQTVQGSQCYMCFECTMVINGADSCYYEAWERIFAPSEESGQRIVPVLRKLCRECGIKQIPENTR
jgi:hypothetical protein